jgi:hypothetical protein
MDIDENHRMFFEAALDAWKFQVDSYWTRMSHFAVFELAFAAGLWKVFDGQHYYTSAGLAAGAIALTIIWIANNSRIHEYILFNWSRVAHFESLLALSPQDSIVHNFQSNRPPKTFPGEYHQYIHTIPVLFLLGWLWMLIWSLRNLAHFMNLR